MKDLYSYMLTESAKDPGRIFIIIKPGFEKLSQIILEKFADAGWKLEMSKTKTLLLSEAKKLYAIHKKEEWYKPLCEYMSSGPTMAFILRNDSIPMTPKVFEITGAIKDEIRDEYGESDMRNVIHSSDSIEHMNEEKAIYFAI